MTMSACFYYFVLGNKCFGVFGVDGKETKTWEEAHAFCQTQQGIKPDLASVNSPAENGKSEMELVNSTRHQKMLIWQRLKTVSQK